jgi:CheY-like chemotaxis protein/two-component sensor histidine kinase
MQAQLDRSERMASLGTLAAGVAHEINNPLTYVVSNLEVIEQTMARERPELADAVRQAREGVERVREVVRGLRSFSRGGAARGPVDVGEELHAAVRIARNEIQHRAALDLHVDPMPPVDAKGRELGQVFLNLLVNAGQAIPEDPMRRGRVTVRAGTDADGRARIEIQDDGVGIPADVLPRIFEPFFTTKPVGVGTGLGLSIAHNVVAEAGGTIEVESQLGVGTTFRVLLPPARGAGDAVAREERRVGTPVPAGAAGGAEPPVLVVDDEPLVARSIARALQREVRVEVAGSAEEARGRLAAGERFAAVVCDLMMPGMTGMDLHEWAEANVPSLASRFVFVTGGAFTQRARAFLERTRAPCVDKPFEAARLREVVRAAAAAGEPGRARSADA